MPEPVIVRRDQALSVQSTDPLFAHGFGLFETIKLDQGRLCFWRQHWQRLVESAEAIGLECPCSEADARRAAYELVQLDGLENCAIKLSLVRIASGAQLYLYARDYQPAASQVRLRFSRAVPLNESSPLAGHKTHNYMENLLLLEQCRLAGYHDLLRSNTAGALAETTVANIFCVVDGVLHTPSLDTGVLPGVIREEVLRLAHQANVQCQEDIYLDYILEDADCVFLTNSLQGMVSVGRIDGDGLSFAFESNTHPLFSQLSQALYESELASETVP